MGRAKPVRFPAGEEGQYWQFGIGRIFLWQRSGRESPVSHAERRGLEPLQGDGS